MHLLIDHTGDIELGIVDDTITQENIFQGERGSPVKHIFGTRWAIIFVDAPKITGIHEANWTVEKRDKSHVRECLLM